MERNTMWFDVRRGKAGEEHLETNMIVLFLLEGSMTIRYQEEKYIMRREDLIHINPGMHYEIEAAEGALYAVAGFTMGFMTRVLRAQNVMFFCNSMVDDTHSYQDLRDLFYRLTAEFTARTRQSDLLLDGLLLGVLDTMVEHYQINKEEYRASETESDLRMREIMQYIIANLDSEINLTELAEQMYVSTSTLSRLFKKNTGVYFADYVMQLRVKSSLPLLNYSEQNLTQIALSCGFANSASFSRAFRKYMDMTPSEYREQHKKDAAGEKAREEAQEAEIRAELKKHGYEEGRQETLDQISIDASFQPPARYHKNWNKIINMCSFFDMTKANIQYHTAYLAEQLHFQYVRIWNVFSKRILFTDGSVNGPYNYDIINQVLDFLVQHHLRPFLDFGRRPDTALRSKGNVIYYVDDYIEFVSEEAWQNAVKNFLAHIVRRYDQEEVSGWIYEITNDSLHKKTTTKLYDAAGYLYFDAYEFFYRELRKRIPGARFGGTGEVIATYWDHYVEFAQRCIDRDCVPDYLSFILFPYDDVKIETGDDSRRLSQVETVEENQIAMIRQLMEQTGLAQRGVKLFVTEWNNSISNRNYLNDSCFRSAYMVRKIGRIWDSVDQIAVMCGSDWVSSYMDTVGLVNGGIGLLSKDTIRKPAYYALEFLGELGGYLLDKGDRFIATRHESGDITILAFYYSWFRRSYFLQSEDVKLEDYRSMVFADEKPIHLSITLNNLTQTGDYYIKRKVLSRRHGSILDEWGKFQYETRLSREDVKYLQAASFPDMGQEKQTIRRKSDVLQMEVEMEPQEVVLLHIFRGE